MAGTKTQEHAYKTFTSALKAGEFPSAILLCGSEDYLIDWALQALEKKYLNPATAMLDCNIFSDNLTDPAELIAACETLPLASQRKLVILKADPDQIDGLPAYLPQIPDSTLLVCIKKRPEKIRSFYKAIQKCGIVYDFQNLDETTLAGWVRKRLADAGKEASRSDILRFASEAGYFDPEREYGLYHLAGDLEKACMLYPQKTLSADDLLEVSAAQDEVNAFKLLDAAFSKRKGEALKLLHANIEAEDPSRQIGAIIRFLGLLCSQLEIMLEARERSEDGQDQAQIQKEMGVSPFRLQKAVRTSERLSTARLRTALSAVYGMERDLKGGKLDGRLALELFIAKL